MKNWVLAKDILELVEGEERISASWEQIYAAIVEKTPAWTDLPAGKSGDAADLSFSRYPVDLRAVISEGQKGGRPWLTFEARTQQGAGFPVSTTVVRRGHVTHSGTWYPVAVGDGAAISLLLREAEIDPAGGEIQTLRACLTLKKAAAEGRPIVDRLPDDALKRQLFRRARDAAPEGVLANLYPYQVDGWRWLQFLVAEHLGGLLGDEMGLGKTLQIISALRDPGGHSAIDRTLVVAPGSLLENWVRELAKFCPSLKACKHHGPMRTGRPNELKRFDVVISSYDTVVRDLSLLKMVNWSVVVLDEAQYIRNPEALRTRSVKEIPRSVSLAVTGTPVENRLRDLWSIMDFVLPGYLGNLPDFETRYAESGDAAAQLEPLVSPLLLRRRIAEHAADLPKRIDIVETLQLRDDEAEAYETVRETVAQQYGPAASLVSLARLRQFCAHPALVDCGDATAEHGEFTKIERLWELLGEIFAWQEKVLVFTSYTSMADRIAAMCRRNFGVMVETLDGRLPTPERQPLLDSFALHQGPAALVLNPRAGGAGLNITAANHVIHYNPEWNPALEDQAAARAHRRGQTRPVTVRRLIFSRTVEEVMDERLRRKREIAERAVVGVEGSDADYADVVAALERSPISRGGVT